MNSFENIIKLLPLYLEKLLEQKEYLFADLTEGEIKKNFNTREPVSGVFIMFEKEKPVYVGRSKNLAQRIGIDLRAVSQSQATLTYKIMKSEAFEFKTMEDTRNYMYKYFTTKMFRIDDEHERAIFQIYASMKLETKYNNFMES
ncbi:MULTISPECIES: hypothetical protein [Clostridium]|uniref:hypothetical protein n=1 Tax=Clostridium TaxID=1485 RepID=UPI00082501A7|nr:MULTISPECIES: hypothetical protein [Clostridium]PJI07211.1 hypothetical protein CUB90_04730 [Clostridium sp. CT7]